jgi:hypothetical protein
VGVPCHPRINLAAVLFEFEKDRREREIGWTSPFGRLIFLYCASPSPNSAVYHHPPPHPESKDQALVPPSPISLTRTWF